MANTSYDIVIVGGGLGGSAIAKVLAERGACFGARARQRISRSRTRRGRLAVGRGGGLARPLW
jgi:flavin-dependent dehydrogenase